MKTKDITITLDSPNFDVAVDRAVRQVEETHFQLREQPQQIDFVKLTIETRDWYGRENRFNYEFRVTYQ